MDVLIERLFGARVSGAASVWTAQAVFGARRYGGYLRARHVEAPLPESGARWTASTAFDLVSQRRKGSEKFYLSPAREVLFGDTEAAERLLRTALPSAKPAYAEASWPTPWTATSRRWTRGMMPAAMDKYPPALRYEKPATIFEYSDAPIVFLNELSGRGARPPVGVEFRFGEAFKACWKTGAGPPGLDYLYDDTGWLSAQ